MGRLASTFERLRAQGEIAFIPGIVPGDPSLDMGLEIVRVLTAGGADAIELSYSFSDPVADGVTLQAAHTRVLAGGLRKERAYRWIEEVRAVTDLPLLVLEYGNCIYQFGVDRFYSTLADCGADTVIAIDVPLDEAADFRAAAGRAGIGMSFFVSPSTSDERVREIAGAAQDWIYVVAVPGVTGARARVEELTAELLRRSQRFTQLPLVVGFGVARPEHMRRLAATGADGAISSSATIDLIHGHRDRPAVLLSELDRYVREMKAASRRDPSSDPLVRSV
jgi:tryptophan synthase alpha chain